MKQKKVLALILTKNEAATIHDVISEIRAWALDRTDMDLQVGLVDDSTDETRTIARELGVMVIEGQGRGLGHSYGLGLRRALEQNVEYLFTIDGDGQTDLSELETFWNSMNRQNLDLVLGSRFLDGDRIEYEYPKINRLGVLLLSWYMSLVSGVRITDSHGGLRLYSRRAIESIRLRGSHTYVQESILSVARENLKIEEVASKWNPRRSGGSRVVNSKLEYFIKMAWPLAAAGIDSLCRRARR